MLWPIEAHTGTSHLSGYDIIARILHKIYGGTGEELVQGVLVVGKNQEIFLIEVDHLMMNLRELCFRVHFPGLIIYSLLHCTS